MYNLKIKNLIIYKIKKKKIFSKYPLPNFYKKGFIFIKLISEENIEGLGEISPYYVNDRLVINQLIRLYKNFFFKKSVKEINLLNVKKKIQSRLVKPLISCFDQAIQDIKSKKKNISVTNLISGKKVQNKIHLYASGGMLFEKQKYTHLIDEAIKSEEKGYFGYKFRPKVPNKNLSHIKRIKYPPNFDIDELIAFCHELKTKVSKNFKLMIDIGCRGQDIKKVNYLLDALKELDFFFIEEPLKRNLTLYKKLKLKTKKFQTKIAGGENFYDYNEFYNYNRRNIFDFYQPDSNLLLFDELKKIAKNIDQNKIIMHNWCNKINFASNLSFAFSLKKKIIVEKNIIKNPFDSLFISENFDIKNGHVFYKQKKGLGITFEPNKKDFIIYEKKI